MESRWVYQFRSVKERELGHVDDATEPIEDEDIRVAYGSGIKKDGNGTKRTYKYALLAHTPEE